MTISEEVSKKGFIKHIGGIEFKNISENNFEFQSKVQDFNLNSAGIPHGGYIAAILDNGMGSAAHRVIENNKRCVTISLDIKFIGSSKKDDILIGCFEDDELEGCCILTKEGNGTIRLRQMAVTDILQGKGIGRVLMQFAENIARDKGFTLMTMHARSNAVGFYEKLGYKIVGEEFYEVTIPHCLMEKEL